MPARWSLPSRQRNSVMSATQRRSERAAVKSRFNRSGPGAVSGRPRRHVLRGCAPTRPHSALIRVTHLREYERPLCGAGHRHVERGRGGVTPVDLEDLVGQVRRLVRIARVGQRDLLDRLHPGGERPVTDPERPGYLDARPIRAAVQGDRFTPELLGILRWTTQRGLLPPERCAPESGVQQSGSTPVSGRGA